MNKITKFKDIPQFTKSGSWEADFSLEYLVKHINFEIEEYGLQLTPDFQRGHVWTEEQQVAWLEFFLRGGKTNNVIYLNNPTWHFSADNEDAYNDYVCVDGLQRLTAIQRFINNEIKVFGSYYKEYTDKIRHSHTIRLNVNDLKTKAEVLQWYIEINSGGTPHTDEEIDRVRNMLSALQN